MRYPVIIKKQQEYRPSSGIPVIVRQVMDTIETDIRFKMVQYTRCYLELLHHAFMQNNLEDKIKSLPALPLYLEIGACSGTMVNLIGLGFSRTTAGLINEKAAKHDMDRNSCYRWLKRQNWESSDLPRVCRDEIKAILGGS
jgi:hypothetical protein